MSIKIEQKIIKSAVLDKASPQQGAASEPPKADVIHMHEKLARPESLQGITYKIKTPLSEHALYVTINDIVLNPGTEHELRRPFEIFINSKNMEHFQWITAYRIRVKAMIHWKCSMFLELMKISKGRRSSCSVPGLRTMSLIVT